VSRTPSAADPERTRRFDRPTDASRSFFDRLGVVPFWTSSPLDSRLTWRLRSAQFRLALMNTRFCAVFAFQDLEARVPSLCLSGSPVQTLLRTTADSELRFLLLAGKVQVHPTGLSLLLRALS